jgi:putative ABC transport system permease protein
MSPIVLRLAFAGIRHRLLASALTITLSAAVAATVVVALEVGATGREPWQRTFEAAHGAHVLASVRTEADARAIAAQPGVAEAAEPIPSSLARLRTVGGPGNDVAVIVAGLNALPSVNMPVVTDGIAAGEQGVVLERSFAQALGLRPGMTVGLSNDGTSTELEVVGIAILPSQPRYPRSNPGLVWAHRAVLEQLVPDRSTWEWTQAVRLEDPGRAGVFVTTVARSFPPGQAFFSTDHEQEELALVDSQPISLLATAYALMLLVVVLAVAAILVGARARQQAREIGLLKAVGLTPRQVGGVFAIESAALGLVGVLLGFGVGVVVSPLIARTLSSTLLGTPTAAPNPWHALVAACPVLLVLVVGTWISTRRRTRLGVTNAIQSATATPGSPTLVVRLIGLIGAAPPVDLGLRSIAAVRSRAVMLLAALTVTGAAVVFALSMQASLDARPAGVPSDVPDSLPILVYTLDAVLLLIASMSLIAIALLSVRERMVEFGVLKTLGFTPGQVNISLTSSHALLALFAGVLAIPIGIALYGAAFALAGGSSSDRTIASPTWLAFAALGLVVMAALSVSLPAWVATRIRVAETLRYE